MVLGMDERLAEDLAVIGERLPEAVRNSGILNAVECDGAQVGLNSEQDVAVRETRKLDLSRTEIRTLPAAIGGLQNLEVLSCAGVSTLQFLDDEVFGKLQMLRELDLSRTKICALPEAMGSLVNLQVLNCFGTWSLRSMDGEVFRNLRKLHKLDLSSTGILTIPTAIGGLTNLKVLKCGGELKSIDGKIFQTLSSLLELELSCAGIDKLPAEIGGLTHLEVLNCSGLWNLVSVSGDLFKNLTNLRKLDLSETPIENLPTEIGGLLKLRVLRCFKARRLKELDGKLFEKLKNLYVLDLSQTQIRTLPAEIKGLVSLRELDLTNTCICNLPAEVGRLKKLQVLRCSGLQRLQSLGGSIFRNLTELCELDLSNTGIWELPLEIGGLVKLQVLRCAGLENLCSLHCDVFRNLKQLQKLDLSFTGLREIPIAIASLTNLRELKCWRVSNLQSLNSEALGKLKELRTLDLCITGISDLPPTIGGLANLKVLNCNRTNISSVPAEIGNLKHLEKLMLRECDNLKELPSDITEMDSLRVLSLMSCKKLETPPLEYLGNLNDTEEVARRAKNYFREIKKAEASPDFKVGSRVLFLGHSLSGKTQLVHMLTERKFKPIQLDDRTDCAVVHHTARTGRNGASDQRTPYYVEHLLSEQEEENQFLKMLHNRDVSIWDLAGQREFAFLHNRFLTNRVVYVVVVTAEREQERPGQDKKVPIDDEMRVRQVHSWVQRIRLIGCDAPLMVVLNKFKQEAGGPSREDMKKSLRQGLEEIGCTDCVQEIIVTDDYGNEAMEILSDEQQEQMSSLRGWIEDKLDSLLNPRMPKVMEIAQKVTREMAEAERPFVRPFVSYEEWMTECDAAMSLALPGEKRLGEGELRRQLKILNESGTVMWDDQPVVGMGEEVRTKKSVLLDPHWAIEKFCLLYGAGNHASRTLQTWKASAGVEEGGLLDDFNKRGVIMLWKSDLEKAKAGTKCDCECLWSPNMELFQKILLSDEKCENASELDKARFLLELFNLAVQMRMAYRRDCRAKQDISSEADAVEFVFPGRLCETDDAEALNSCWRETWDDLGRQLVNKRDRVYGWRIPFRSLPMDFIVPIFCSMYNESGMEQNLWVTDLLQPQDHLERALLRAVDVREGADHITRVDVRYENMKSEIGHITGHVLELVVRLTYAQDVVANGEVGDRRMWEVFTRVLEHTLNEIDTHARKSRKENRGLILYRFANSQSVSKWTIFKADRWSLNYGDEHHEDLLQVNGEKMKVPMRELRPPSTVFYGERVHLATHTKRYPYKPRDRAEQGQVQDQRDMNKTFEHKIAPAMDGLLKHAESDEDERLLSKITCPYMFKLEDYLKDERGRLSKQFFDEKKMLVIDQRTMETVREPDGSPRVYPLRSFLDDRRQTWLVYGLGTFKRRYDKYILPFIAGSADVASKFERKAAAAKAAADLSQTALELLVDSLNGFELNATIKDGGATKIAEGGFATGEDRRFRIDMALDPKLLEEVGKKLEDYDISKGRAKIDALMHREIFMLKDGSKIVMWVANNANDLKENQKKAEEEEKQLRGKQKKAEEEVKQLREKQKKAAEEEKQLREKQKKAAEEEIQLREKQKKVADEEKKLRDTAWRLSQPEPHSCGSRSFHHNASYTEEYQQKAVQPGKQLKDTPRGWSTKEQPEPGGKPTSPGSRSSLPKPKTAYGSPKWVSPFLQMLRRHSSPGKSERKQTRSDASEEL